MTRSISRNSLSTFQLRRRTPGSFLLVPCPRMGRSIRCQGQLEAAAASILANCPLVTFVQEQPLQIWYAWREKPTGLQIRLVANSPQRRRVGGSSVSYVVPDFLVRMSSGKFRLVEVKPSSQLDKTLVQRKLAVARAYARQRGWEYHVLTEQELFAGSLLANVRLLARYRQASVTSDICDRLIQFIATVRTGTLSRFAETIGEPHLASLRPVQCHLLAINRLDCDPVVGPIDIHTSLYPGGTQLWDPFDSGWGHSGCGKEDRSASSVNSPPDGFSSGI